MPSVKAHELRYKNTAELGNQLIDLKQELNTLRVQAVSGSENATKSGAIRTARKAIARVLTVMSEQRKSKLVAQCGKGNRLPLDMRAKKTRALRRALSKEDAGRVTLRQQKRVIHFPKLKYVLKP